MTREEEILYLSDLCLQAARWTRDADEPLSSMELEVQDRLRRLCGVDTVDENGLAQSKPKKQYTASTNPGHVGKLHVSYNGTKRWVPEEWVTKEPFGRSKTGFHYVPVPEYRAEFNAKFGIKE